MKAEMPLAFWPGSVRAMTTAIPPTLALVMNALLPFSTKPPSRGSARVRRAAASEPEPGSVRPHAPSVSPLARRGRYFAFCSREAKYLDRKSTRLNSSHSQISYAVFCLKKKKITIRPHQQGSVFLEHLQDRANAVAPSLHLVNARHPSSGRFACAPNATSAHSGVFIHTP